jgi:Asp-tRNA(Asn)/Glu-tRNA(Gln) amidotransferase A subunit family amidase
MFSTKSLVGIMSAEGNMRSFVEAVEGEPMVSDYETMLRTRLLPQWAKYILGPILGSRVRELLEASRQLSVYELWGLVAELLDMRTKWASAVEEAGLDAIVHPAIPIPAVRHGMSAKIPCVSYMLTGPMLLWPTGVLPVTTVRDDEQHYYESPNDRDQLPKDQHDHLAYLTAKEMKGSAGMPINISVLAPAYKDETCLRVMKEIETAVDFKARATAYKG